MKNNKGITLIALVVTIIVLLILAGVSIAMLTGQNGILNRASEASYESKLSNAAESMSYNVTEAITAHYNTTYVTGTTDKTGADSIEKAIVAGIVKSISGTSPNYTATSDSNVKVTLGAGIVTTTGSEAVTAGDTATITLTYGGHKKVGTISDTKTGISWGNVVAE